MSNSNQRPGPPQGEVEHSADDTHLEDVIDGCGCVEVWEHLSRERNVE